MKFDRNGFWSDALTINGSVTPQVLRDVLAFGLIALAICGLVWATERESGWRIGLQIAPYEIAGAALGLLLVLRTNAGYDRWWEARKLWGGIVNQSRNLAAGAVAYGPGDAAWRAEFLHWVAVFPQAARCSLRGEPPPEVAAGLAAAGHVPLAVTLQLARLLREARERHGMDGFAFVQLDRQRTILMDHLGGCERILKTPLPVVYAFKIRRFIALFLLALPFALLHRLESEWFVPVLTMMVAYPLLAVEQIGVELQNPFATANLSHLPLSDIAATIERNVAGLAGER